MQDDNLIITKEEHLCTITLNRADKHNTFNAEIIKEMIIALDEIEQDETIRVVMLKSNGEYFSAGADLNWMSDMINYDHQQNLADSQQLALLMYKLNTLSAATIAIIHGGAFGGGIGLIACCDIALANSNSVFAFSEVKIGLIPAVISPYVIAKIGHALARRYLLTAEKFDATEALKMNLINEIHHELLERKGRDIAAKIISNSPQAVKLCKKLIHHIHAKEINEELIAYLAEQIASIRNSNEGQEGLHAFLEKRSPNWNSSELKSKE